MSDAEKQAAPAAAAEPTSSGGGSKLVVILTLVNLLVSVGVGAVLFISHKKDKQAAAVTDIQPGEEPKAEEHGGGHGGGGEHGGGHGGGEHGGGAKEKPKGEARMVNLDQFTVNLSTPGASQQKFVRVNISIEVATEEAESEIQGKMPQVRNSIIDLFNGKRPTDLQSAEQRDFLKEEIKNALNSFMSTGKVKGVYFTNFAVTG